MNLTVFAWFSMLFTALRFVKNSGLLTGDIPAASRCNVDFNNKKIFTKNCNKFQCKKDLQDKLASDICTGIHTFSDLIKGKIRFSKMNDQSPPLFKTYHVSKIHPGQTFSIGKATIFAQSSQDRSSLLIKTSDLTAQSEHLSSVENKMVN